METKALHVHKDEQIVQLCDDMEKLLQQKNEMDAALQAKEERALQEHDEAEKGKGKGKGKEWWDDHKGNGKSPKTPKPPSGWLEKCAALLVDVTCRTQAHFTWHYLSTRLYYLHLLRQ